MSTSRLVLVRPTEAALLKANSNPRASETIVPMTPRAVQLCRYYGSGFTPKAQRKKTIPGHLRTEFILKKLASVRSIAHEFDALEPAPEGPISCPSDDGERLYAVFAYSDGEPSVAVEVDLSGCPFVSNGKTGHLFWATSQLTHRLRRLTSR